VGSCRGENTKHGEIEAAIFRKVVASVPHDHFSAEAGDLLSAYCRALALERRASEELATAATIGGQASPWLAVYATAVRALATLTVRLRSGPKARHPSNTRCSSPQVVATGAVLDERPAAGGRLRRRRTGRRMGASPTADRQRVKRVRARSDRRAACDRSARAGSLAARGVAEAKEIAKCVHLSVGSVVGKASRRPDSDFVRCLGRLTAGTGTEECAALYLFVRP
jgi:hypothetical protein